MMSRRLPSQDSFDDDLGGGSNTAVESRRALASPALPTTESMVQKLSQTLSKLRVSEEYLSQAAYADIKYLWNLSRYTPDRDMRSRVIGGFGKEKFVDLFQQMWIAAQKEDIFNSEVLYPWKNLRNSLSIVWNCCDSSMAVCEQMTTSGLLPKILESLKEVSDTKDYLENDRKLYYIKALFGILHNCVRNYSDCHSVLINSNGIESLHNFTTCSHPMVKAKSLIIISYLVDEEQNEVISASSDTLKFIVNILKESLTSVDHFAAKYGMNAVEVVKGLNNIAHNDTNKVKLVDCGVVPCLRSLLLSESDMEKTLAATGIWALSFAKENKTILKEDQECIKALQNLARCEEKSVSHAARGALWEIFHDQQMSLDPDLEANTPHVMISYQWDAQDVMIKVKDRLRQAGFKVWMDVENMSGSTLEAMALAVEKAAVVLICMSDKYKQSPSCRTESEYIFRLRKDIIPLRLQSKFVPDGWLGMLVGSRLYFDFSQGDMVDKQMIKLYRELGSRGKIRSTSIHDLADGMFMSSSGSSLLTDSLSQSISCWTRKEVADWLSATGFDHVKERFSDFDGGLLFELKKLQKNAPEFFYTNLKSEIGLKFCDVLRFSRALSML
ncbi:uncharacterized protein LOC124114439 isoform X2 [Haliotis rufescens]|nr:uncharacterized protein LOC124114439 isoform X2 [Haliotis rufescens]